MGACQGVIVMDDAFSAHRPRQGGGNKVSLKEIPRTLNALLPYWWMNVLFPASAKAEAGTTAGQYPSRTLPAPSGPTQIALLLLLFAMTCVLFFARLDHPLLEPEEARYAEIPRQMLLEGRFLTPVLHHEDYWQKPPLL